MSRAVQTQFEFARKVTPGEKAQEPDLWFQELRLMRRLSTEEDALIRRIPLRAGLNILWSPPEDAESNTELYREAWGGHAAGKTLFCRILRYLLGDSAYCTHAVLENVQSKFLELWAVARVRVLGEAWIVGRSLIHLKESFAVRSEDLDTILTGGKPAGDIAVFFAQMEVMAGAPLKQLHPVDSWRHLMPWLARDQEARYARVTAWRDTLSEADNPSTSMTKQYALMRAVLGLLKPQEHELQTAIEKCDEGIRHSLPQIDRLAAVEERERHLLSGIAKQALGRDLDLVDPDAAGIVLQSHREVRQERLDQLEREPESAATRTARVAYEAAFSELTRVREQSKGYASRHESLTRQGNELMGTVDRAKSAGIVDPKRSMQGWCPRTIEWAQDHGCAEKPADADKQSSVTIKELEEQANGYLEEAEQAETEKNRCESRLEMLEAVVADKSKQYAEVVRASRQDTSKLQREVTLLDQCTTRLNAYKETAKGLARERESHETRLSQQDKRRKEIETLRKEAEKGLGYFNGVFSDVIKAVVGASVDAWVQIDGNGMHLHATKQGELSGAALETVKTLAFDLAGVIAGIEGKCLHPRFLIHDGPREADMARVIYERFFIYAVDRLETPFRNGANFQYILTTTTAPPKGMQDGSDWLIQKLSSRNRADRLLCEDV